MQRRLGRFELGERRTFSSTNSGSYGDTQVALLEYCKNVNSNASAARNPLNRIRVIAATNRDLERLLQTGHFRQDLHYR